MLDIEQPIDFELIASNTANALAFRKECSLLSKLAEWKIVSSGDNNQKLLKSKRKRYRIVSVNMAHHMRSGYNVCAQASAACSAACVGGTGLAAIWDSVELSRIHRTRFLFEHRKEFLVQFIGELHGEHLIAQRNGEILVCRYNCFSDLPWHTADFGCVPQIMHDVQGYDYVKVHSRILNQEVPANWHLTASWSELARHQRACLEILQRGLANVAMVFNEHGSFAGNAAKRQRIPQRITLSDGHRYECIDGDLGPAGDLRFMDPGKTSGGFGRVVCLRLKANTTDKRNAAIAKGFSVAQ